MIGGAGAVRRGRMVRAWREGRAGALGLVLAPAAWVYHAGLVLREAAYGRGWLARGRLPCPVVSVGNLTVGGTGKTPAVEMVARWLGEDGCRVVIVSRGYGRRPAAPIELVSDGGAPRLPAERAGDEPLLLARHLRGVAVVVGADRLEAGRWAAAHLRPDVVLLDDGFQQRRLLKDVEIVCLDARDPWGPDGLFPQGTLREPRAALARAHLLVVTRADARRNLAGLLAEIRQYAGPVPCLTADYVVEELEDLASAARHPAEALRGRGVLGFAGIAAPERLAETLIAHGAIVRDLVVFPDHHSYGPRDLEIVARRARATGASLVVTTEKDAVRLERSETGAEDGGSQSPLALAALPPVWVLRVRLDPVATSQSAGRSRQAEGRTMIETWRAELRSRVDAAARGDPDVSLSLSAAHGSMATVGTIPRTAIRRALVRLPNWLGDTVMALPTLRSLRDAIPAAELWCLGPWAGVLDGEPGITRRLAPPGFVGARFAQARRLRQVAFDLAVILTSSFETALEGWLSGARWRVGYGNGQGALLTHSLRPDPAPVHQVAAYLRLLGPLGVDGPPTSPTLVIDAGRRVEARRLLQEVEMPAGDPKVGLQLGAALGPAKLWPAERLAALAAALEGRGIHAVLLGSPGSRGLADAVAAAAGRPVRSLVGRDRPALLGALISELDALVAADTGPAHVAAAVGVPTVTLFGPTDPRLTAPLGFRQQALWHQPPCAPCFLRDCPIDHRCLQAIEVAEVEAAVMTALRGRP